MAKYYYIIVLSAIKIKKYLDKSPYYANYSKVIHLSIDIKNSLCCIYNMHNRQNNTLNLGKVGLVKFFDEPVSERQRQYEAVRAFIKEKLPAKSVAERFSYTLPMVYTLVRDAKAGRLNLFPEVKKCPV